MSLLSLLIALLSERHLTNKWWFFSTYFECYSSFVLGEPSTGELSTGEPATTVETKSLKDKPLSDKSLLDQPLPDKSLPDESLPDHASTIQFSQSESTKSKSENTQFESTRSEKNKSSIVVALFLFMPTLLCYLLLDQLNEGFLYLILSTVILIICLGCPITRSLYKKYLTAAFDGKTNTCELIHAELQQVKKLPKMGFGQALVWLNYRYFIAIMLFFVLFGAAGALFYRLLTSLNEHHINNKNTQEYVAETGVNKNAVAHEKTAHNSTHEINDVTETNINEEISPAVCLSNRILFVVDWLPVRIIALGYMLVGHFSKALSIWLSNLFNLNMPPYEVLTSVAQKSEDFMIDSQDCSAEPCILVRLAKRTLLLCLAFISILILTGVL